MTKPFEAAEIKIERAKRHLQELQTEIEEFFGRGGAYVAFEIATEYARASYGETGSFAYRESEPIPTGWSGIIGDVIHNLRSSLDLIACDLHRITGGRPKEIRGVHYPFCANKTELPKTIRDRRLGHIGKDFLAIIETTAPYKGGNDGLRALHDLDILDKHQMIVPTIAVVSIDWPVPIRTGPQQFTTGVVKNGQRLIIFPKSFCHLPLGSKIKAAFSIVFGDVDVFRGSDVVKQLQACLESIEIILGLFSAAADKKARTSVGRP